MFNVLLCSLGLFLFFVGCASVQSKPRVSVLDLAKYSYQHKDFKKARLFLDRALRKDPQNPVVIYYQAKSLIAEQLYSQAIQKLDKVIALDQNFRQAYLDKALCLASLKDFKQAKQVLLTSLRLFPPDFKTYYNLGVISLLAKEFAYAQKQFTLAISLQPNFGPAYLNRGITYLQINDVEKALQDFNQAMFFLTDDPQVYYNRAIAYEQSQEWNLALADYTKAITLQPDFGFAYNNRGILYLKLHQIDLACADLKKACELGTCLKWQQVQTERICLNDAPLRSVFGRN